MNRYKKLFSNTVVLGLGTMGSKLLIFLLMPLYTALLSPAQYSTAELITTTANLLIPVACIGITNGIFRFAADRESDRRAVFSTSVVLLCLGLAAFCAISPLLSLINYFDGYAWLIVAYVFFACLQGVCSQYVRAIDRTTLFAMQGIINTALTIAFNLLFLLVWNMGVTGYVLSVVVGNLLTTLYLVFAAKLWREFSLASVSKRLIKELLRFSLPLIPTTVCWLITDLSDRYMVTYFCGAQVNGIYSAAYKIPTIVNLMSGIFLQAWQFSAVAESSDRKTCEGFYTEVYRGFLSVLLIGTSVLILFSRFLCGLLLNVAYFDAWRYMPILLCAAAFEGLVSFLATVYMVQKKSVNSFLTAMSGAIFNIALNLILIPRIGAIGAAVATAAAYLLVLILRLADTRRMLRFELCLPRLITGGCLLLLGGLAMSLSRSWSIWITLATVIVLFAVNAPTLLHSLRGLLQRRGGANSSND